MSWKIDNIDFLTFGVYVSKSSGVLDLPRIVDNSTNWLDQNGKEYWQSIEDVKYEDHEIVLSCWIKATSYSNFKSGLTTFFNALTSTGKRTLYTPFGNTIEVSLQNEVKVDRKGSYLSNLMLGVFTLRLTVSGDSQTKLMTIYRADGVVNGVAKYGSDAKLTRTLQGDSSISFQSEFNSKQNFGRADYIMFNGEKYVSFEYPEITKQSTNKFVYRLTYTHNFFALKDVQFLVIDNPETSFWATMEDVVDMIISNTQRVYSGLFVKGTVASTINKNFQFNNENCYEVLSRIASDYELEFEYEVNELTGVISINVEKKIGFESGMLVEYGKGNIAYQIKRIPTAREKLCTKLFAFGSTRNIPATYGFPRLKIAPLTRSFYGMQIERTKTFEDIFPERTGIISQYTYTAPSSEDKPETAIYEVQDTSMPFDLKAKDSSGNTIYLIAGTSAKMHFQTGDLAGFEFEVMDYDHSTFTFKLIPIVENGVTYPKAGFEPAPNDTYKLIDINLPIDSLYFADAHSRLYDAAYDYMYNELNPPQANYEVEVNPFYNLDTLMPGDTVHLTDTDFSIDTDLRITDISVNLYNRACNFTLAPYLLKGSVSSMKSDIAYLKRAVQASKIDDVVTVRSNKITTLELKNAVLNPLDEKLKSDEIVRTESLDPRMLSYDSGVPQFFLKGAFVSVNVDGNEDKIKISSGEITITNWKALSRREIDVLGDQYDPTRSWAISETVITLSSKNLHFLYAKLQLEPTNSTVCTIIVSEDHIEVKSLSGHLIYKLGFISEGEGTI